MFVCRIQGEVLVWTLFSYLAGRHISWHQQVRGSTDAGTFPLLWMDKIQHHPRNNGEQLFVGIYRGIKSFPRFLRWFRILSIHSTDAMPFLPVSDPAPCKARTKAGRRLSSPGAGVATSNASLERCLRPSKGSCSLRQKGRHIGSDIKHLHQPLPIFHWHKCMIEEGTKKYIMDNSTCGEAKGSGTSTQRQLPACRRNISCNNMFASKSLYCVRRRYVYPQINIELHNPPFDCRSLLWEVPCQLAWNYAVLAALQLRRTKAERMQLWALLACFLLSKNPDGTHTHTHTLGTRGFMGVLVLLRVPC